MRFGTKVFTGFLVIINLVLSQGKEYEGPEDSAGDIAAEKEGYMTGNRVYLYFRNTTELSDWPRINVSKWPNNPNGLKMTDGIGLLVGAKVYIEDDGNETTVDTIPLTELADIYTKDHHTLYYLQTSYREEMDKDPTGTVEWGFYPVFHLHRLQNHQVLTLANPLALLDHQLKNRSRHGGCQCPIVFERVSAALLMDMDEMCSAVHVDPPRVTNAGNMRYRLVSS